MHLIIRRRISVIILMLIAFLPLLQKKLEATERRFIPEEWATIETDENVQIDGNLNDSVWTSLNEYVLTNNDKNLKMSTKAYLGKKGVSIAFSVKDTNQEQNLFGKDFAVEFSFANAYENLLNEKSVKTKIYFSGEHSTYSTKRLGSKYIWNETFLPVLYKTSFRHHLWEGEIFLPWEAFSYNTKPENIKILPSFYYPTATGQQLVGPRYANADNPSTYLLFNAYGYIEPKIIIPKEKNIDGDLSEWYEKQTRKYQGFLLEDNLETGKSFEAQAYLGSDGLYLAAFIVHSNLKTVGDNFQELTHLEINVEKDKYWVSNLSRSNGLYSSMISKKAGSLYETSVEVFIPLDTDVPYLRVALAFYSENDFMEIKRNRETVTTDYWWLDPHNPDKTEEYFLIYADGMYSQPKNGGKLQKENLGASLLGYYSTNGFDLGNDEGSKAYTKQYLGGEQKVYFRKYLGKEYFLSARVIGKEVQGEKPRIGIIAAENEQGIVAFVLDFETQIHLRIMFYNKSTQEWTDELVTYYGNIRYTGNTLSAIRNKDEFYFFVDGEYIFKKRFEVMTEDASAGLLTINQAAEFRNYYYSDDQSLIDLKKESISNKSGKTMLTIGDSIFDFTDNKVADMVENIARATGYSNLYIDNIGATTIAPLKDRGIVDHVDSGLYENFPEPDIILIQRGTNDCAFVYNGTVNLGEVGNGDKNTTFGAIDYVLSYLRKIFPNSRIIWSNSIYRANLPEETHQALHDALLEICPKYNVEVFDVRKAVGINKDNYTDYLYDGVHLNDAGKALMEKAFIDYITRGQ